MPIPEEAVQKAVVPARERFRCLGFMGIMQTTGQAGGHDCERNRMCRSARRPVSQRLPRCSLASPWFSSRDFCWSIAAFNCFISSLADCSS